MSKDLISRHFFRIELNKLDSEMGHVKKSDVMSLLEKQKTAYDVDKIVVQLEEMKKRNPFVDGVKDNSIEASVSRQTLDYAIEIIKKERM